jgi:serine/threonine protein kinase/tetratricopeptide (TPR) repeat protein
MRRASRSRARWSASRKRWAAVTDRERLEALAALVLEGHSVDWSAEESSAGNDSLRSAIRNLRVLHDVAALHGSAGAADPPEGPSTQPSRWGHLRILEPLGRGSFGEVFRAWDESLDREVALKLVHDDADAIREGRSLARVRHPNFVSVYGAEQRDSRVGLWMEFIQGRTLARILHDQGPFSAQEATLIGIDVCRSVAAVHKAGLLHRDIKAQNVMREVGGRIVLMDLGAGEDRLAAALKKNAPLAGTPMYMAPEVIAGHPATVRSDVYSIGVLLFYLVSGTYPVTARRLDDLRNGALPRRHLRDLRPDLPASFVAVIEHATELEPNERFPTAGALEAALRGEAATSLTMQRSLRRRVAAAALVVALAVVAAVGGWRVLRFGTPRVNVSSIAVLPFEDLSGDEQGRYIADGIVDELIQDLSDVSSLRVISRTSSMYYKDHPKPLADIARELNVDAVIEGSVRRHDGLLKIDARLIDPRTDQNMWRRTMERPETNVTSMQDNLARAVIAGMSRTMRRPGVRAVDARAYDLYLQGRYQVNKRTPEGLRAARDLFDRAIDEDATYGPAHAGLAEAYTLLGALSVIPHRESYARARQAALDALRLDDRLSMPYAVLGYITYEGGNEVAAASKQFRAAIDRDPSNATARQWYALSLSAEGRYTDAIAEIDRAREVDPLSKSVASDAGSIYRQAGKLPEAREKLRLLVSLYPEFAEGHRQLALVYLDLRDYANAVTELENAVRLTGKVPSLLADLGYAYARAGRTADAESVLATLDAQTDRAEDWYYAVILTNAALGRTRPAADALVACRSHVVRCTPPLDRPGLEKLSGDRRVRAAMGMK